MSKSAKLTLPSILNVKQVAKSRLITIEEMDLCFSNGEHRVYEKVKGGGPGAVLIVPMLDDDTMVLIREYCAGTHSYQLGFPKGLIDAGEEPLTAANRELQEEIGMAAEELSFMHEVSLAPAFFDAKMKLFLGEGLYPSKLDGDEPEPLQIVYWKMSNYLELLAQPDFTEARSIAALMFARELLKG